MTLLRSMVHVLAGVSLVLAAGASSADPVLWSVSPRDAILRKVDAATGTTVEALVTLSVAGESHVQGVNGLARHPGTFDLYALVRVPSTPFRLLVTVDPNSGVATRVGPTGDTGDNFAAIAFADDGTLYAVTGAGALSFAPETLCTLSLVDASASCFMALGAGSDGEAIAWAENEAVLFHASGVGVANDPLERILEEVDPIAGSTTPVTISGDAYGEVSALLCADALLYAADRGTGPVDEPRLLQISKTGAAAVIGDLDHVSKGLVPVNLVAPVPIPPFVPVAVGGLLGLLGVARSGQAPTRARRRVGSARP